MIDLASLNVNNGGTWHQVCPFPVGFVYSSYTNTSPAGTFGGSWTSMTGRFPYYNAGTGTGGSNNTYLSSSQMPAHRHAQLAPHSNMVEQLRIVQSNAEGGKGWWIAAASNSSGTISYTESNGSGTAINNMPAYQTLYAWRRIS